jgi:hypothetical protein
MKMCTLRRFHVEMPLLALHAAPHKILLLHAWPFGRAERSQLTPGPFVTRHRYIGQQTLATHHRAQILANSSFNT